MNLYEYQKNAITTKIYEDQVALSYLALGLGGEVIELFEKIKEKNFNKELMSKEIGDVYWYLAGLADELDQELGDIVKPNVIYLKSATLEKCLNNIIIETGVILEQHKKAIRDEFELFQNKELDFVKFEKITKAMSKIVLNLQYIAWHFELSTEEILLQNVTKLKSRADRGVLGGSGDER